MAPPNYAPHPTPMNPFWAQPVAYVDTAPVDPNLPPPANPNASILQLSESLKGFMDQINSKMQIMSKELIHLTKQQNLINERKPVDPKCGACRGNHKSQDCTVVVCAHCKKGGHSEERCFELHPELKIASRPKMANHQSNQVRPPGESSRLLETSTTPTSDKVGVVLGEDNPSKDPDSQPNT